MAGDLAFYYAGVCTPEGADPALTVNRGTLSGGGSGDFVGDITYWENFSAPGPQSVVFTATAPPLEDLFTIVVVIASTTAAHTPQTLVYDIEGKGWSVDTYTPPVECHLWAAGPVDQLLTGCADGSVRALIAGGGETGTAILATRSENGGDARAFKRVGDVFAKAQVAGGGPVGIALWQSRLTVALGGYSPTSLVGTGTLIPYIVDFTSGFADDIDDIAAVFSWPLGSGNILDLWQPDWLSLPETTQDRPTDWDNLGDDGNKLWQGMVIEANTFNVAKTFSVEDDQGNLHTPQPSPVTFNGQGVKAFSFAVPFISHQVRIVSTDGVPWMLWPSGSGSAKWVAVPYPESAESWITELTSQGGVGWQHIRELNCEYISTTPITLIFTVDTGNGSIAPANITIPSSSGTQTKLKLQVTTNKWKLLGYSATSSGPFNLFVEGFEGKIRSWGDTNPYRIARPAGGQSKGGAAV